MSQYFKLGVSLTFVTLLWNYCLAVDLNNITNEIDTFSDRKLQHIPDYIDSNGRKINMYNRIKSRSAGDVSNNPVIPASTFMQISNVLNKIKSSFFGGSSSSSSPIEITPPAGITSPSLRTMKYKNVTAKGSGGRNKGSELTRDYCYPLYGKKRFLPLEQKRLPPMLYTFPGSGNTWCRLLIEHATGVFSGSVYNDDTLLGPFPGEFTCDWRVSVIKIHPHTHNFLDLYSGKFHSDAGKCKRGNVQRFERAILLIRDPFDSIWSEYQRRVTQSHVEGIPRRTFDWSRWQANAAALSHKYHEMWTRHYLNIEKKYPPHDILYLKYEDLKNKKTRVNVLNTVVEFLGLNKASENKKAHREVSTSDMTKDVAYFPELHCRMWNLFGEYAARHGYTPWKNYQNCSAFPVIPNANVGPRGEYDHMWVKAGKKKMDFGGHEPSEFNPKLTAAQKLKLKPRAGRPKVKKAGAKGGPGSSHFMMDMMNPGGRGQNRIRRNFGALSEGSEVTSPGVRKFEGLSGGVKTVGDALSMPGVANIGADKPAWSD